MKTKSPLLIFAGVTLTVVVFIVVVAQNKFSAQPTTEIDTLAQFPVASGGNDVSKLPIGTILPVVDSSGQEKPEPPLVITKDPTILKGKGFFYAENGVLHKQAINDDGTLAITSKIVATGSLSLVDQSEDLLLFTKDLAVGSHASENELWILDKKTGETKKIRDNVVLQGQGYISPQGNLLAVTTNDDQLLVLARDGGGLVAKIGVQGTSPMFSPDGKKIAYIKLKDEKITMGDEDMLQGVAIYDQATGKDMLISKTGGQGKEYKLTGWSPDGKRIFFPSSNDAIWSVALDGTGKRQETNKGGVTSPFVPTYLSQLLFTDDGTMAFGEADGVWAFRLGKNGEFLSAKKIVEGVDGYVSMLSWLKKGESINFRTYGGVNQETGAELPKASTTVYYVSDLK